MEVWETIESEWEAFKSKIDLRVGSGSKVNFWKDRWYRDTPVRGIV